MLNADERAPDDAASQFAPRCCFCNKCEGQAGFLLEGPEFEGTPQAYICADCARLCSSYFERSSEPGASAPAAIKESVDRLLGPLTDLERQVVKLRHGLEDGCSYSLTEVGRLLSLPPERVREVEDVAVAKLKLAASPGR